MQRLSSNIIENFIGYVFTLLKVNQSGRINIRPRSESVNQIKPSRNGNHYFGVT
jgi:hypothetical protein